MKETTPNTAMPATFDLEKIKQLVATASTPKQKAMYQDLLDKALMQQEAKSATPKQEPRKLVSKPREAKQEPKEKVLNDNYFVPLRQLQPSF